jgi:4-hydroxy-tetrahydrodipicolinate synthase
VPLVIYDVPSRTSVDIAPETVRRLFRGRQRRRQETTKDFEHVSRVLHVTGPDLLVWSAIEQLCLPLLALGGAGFVSAVANLASATVARMYQAWTSGDQETARDQHPLVDLLFTQMNPAAAKWVPAQRGLISSPFVRPPPVPLAESGQAKAKTAAGQAEDLLCPLD